MAQTADRADSGLRRVSGEESRLPLREIPSDHEAERAVLGAVLLDHETYSDVADMLRPDSFNLPRHRVIFRAFQALSERRQAITVLTLRNKLDEMGELEAVGGLAALTGLLDSVVTTAHIQHHAQLVHEKALARSLIRICEGIAARGYEASQPIAALLDDAEREVLKIGMGRAQGTFSSVDEELAPTVEYLEAVHDGKIVGVQSGFASLDRLTGGLHPGDLSVLAARPSLGKSALALNIARNHALSGDGSVAVFSLEMSRRELVMRLLLGEAKIEPSKFREGLLSQADWRALTAAASKLQGARIYLDESVAITVGDLLARARRLHREKTLTLVIVDYIQLIQGRDTAERREQQVADISRSLKLLAKELQVPVLALSQLNRGPESRPDKRPQLGDLRESGAIEQDADLVAFIYRDEVYHEDTERQGIAELIVAKHRNGPIGTVELQFEGRYGRFHDLERREQTPPEAGFADPEQSFLDPDVPFGTE